MKDGQGWARRVTKDNLHTFASYLRRLQDETIPAIKKLKAVAIEKSALPSLFTGKNFHFKSRFTAPKLKRIHAHASQSSVATASVRGALLWRRKLSASDAQKTTGNTNPTGCLRFIQAQRENINKIDQTRYFRNDIFGRFPWQVLKQRPYEESTTVPFHVTINGQELGVYDLQIRHKPSGESGQGNYTTSLHWGALMPTIRNDVSAGQVFSLYAPSAATNEPFFVDIS